MTPLLFALVTFGTSILAGILGSLLGLGGGIVVVPVLTLLLHVDIRYAVGASIVSVIATSSGAAATYVRERMTNLRVAMLLELGTTSGALTGAYLAGVLNPRWIFIIFGVVMAYSATVMLQKGEPARHAPVAPDPLADRLRLHGRFFDPALGAEHPYHVTRVKLGVAMMYVAGVLSALLGIGSGALKVPAMDLAMRMPIKVSTATSNFMIGVTAAASAGAYFVRGDINPFIAAPIAAGILIGATIGSRLLGRLHSRNIRIAFVVVMIAVSVQMFLKGVRG